MCFGVPSFAEVRNTVARKHRSPFIILVWQHLDTFRFAHADSDKADGLLRGAYEVAREHVMAGGALPEIPVTEIEHKKQEKPVPASPETVAKHMAEIGEILSRDKEAA